VTTRPGPRLASVLWVLAAGALAVPVVPPLRWALLAGLAAVVAAALLERRALGRVGVAVERPRALALGLDAEEALDLALRTDAPWPVRLEVRQVWPGVLAPASARAGGVVPPGRDLEVRFGVRAARRGRAALAGPHLALSRWGLVERVVQAGEPTEVSVLPNLSAVGRLRRALDRFALQGLGARVAPRVGKGREFDRLREYRTDDDYRDIAWKASARHGKLIVQEYRLDRSQDVLVGVDRGHRMAARTTRVTRVDHAVDAAVQLAYLCDRLEDRVGVLSFGAGVDRGVGQGRGPHHLRRVVRFATGVEAARVHTDYLALAGDLRRRLKRRTLVVLLTDLPIAEEGEDLLRAVGLLLPRHLPLVVVLADPALEARAGLLPRDQAELARALVARDLAWRRRRTVLELRRRGALVVETPPERLGVEAMNGYLEVKRRQLL